MRSISPTSSYLDNNTIYTFNFTINATGNNLEEFGMSIGNATTVFATDTDTSSSGGTVGVAMNTGLNKTFVMRYYFVVDGKYGNFTKVYYIYDSSGSDWSILNFFEDLRTYADDGDGEGIFGLTSFGLSIIIFLIIFFITGIMAYKFSISSPAMIVLILFLLVLIFDVGLGMIGNPVGAIPHFPTIFIALILAGLFFKEVTE